VLLYAPLHSDELQSRIRDKGREFHLKLDIADDMLKELVIKIPDTFSSLSFDMSEAGVRGREFIPQGESFESWNEIISFHECIKIQPSLKEFISRYVDGSKKILKREVKEENQIPTFIVLEDVTATLVTPVNNSKIQTKDLPGKMELIGTKVVQGKFSLAVAQYTIRYNNGTSKEEKQMLKQKVLSFLNDCKVEYRERKEKKDSP
jgi:hypothetical protein